MTPVRKRPQFLLDFTEELTWLNERAGAEVAQRWYQALKDTIRLLRQQPGIGRLRHDLNPRGIRSWRLQHFKRWLLSYRLAEDDSIVLLRLRSGTMNLVVLEMNA